MEVLEDLLKAGLAHLQSNAAVAEEARAPDAEHRLAAMNAGGDDKSQEGVHLLGRDGTPAFIRAETLLKLLGVHVGLGHHVLDAVVWNKELEEVQGCGSGRHLLSGAWGRRGENEVTYSRKQATGKCSRAVMNLYSTDTS